MKTPIHNHGEGTQSLSILFLLCAYLKKRLAADYDQDSDPIIAIDEPEAHLHPNAIRAVWHILSDLRGQKIVATHSGDILSEVSLTKLRRLSRDDSSTTVCKSIPQCLLDPNELRMFNYHVRMHRGELFFARCLFLVEGETDAYVFAECAKLLGIELHSIGVRFLEISQAGGPKTFIKVADALGDQLAFDGR